MRPPQHRSSEPGARKVCSLQIGAGEIGTGNVRALADTGSLQLRTDQVGIPQARAPECGVTQVRAGQVGPSQVGLPENRPMEILLRQLSASQSGALTEGPGGPVGLAPDDDCLHPE